MELRKKRGFGWRMKNKIAFELWCWQHSNTGCFNNMLFELIAKADFINKERIRDSFPEFVLEYERWCEADSPQAYYRENGIEPNNFCE